MSTASIDVEMGLKLFLCLNYMVTLLLLGTPIVLLSLATCDVGVSFFLTTPVSLYATA